MFYFLVVKLQFQSIFLERVLWIGRFGPGNCQVNKYWWWTQSSVPWSRTQTISLIYLWKLEWCKCVCVSLADLVSPDSPPTHTQTLTFPFIPAPALFLPHAPPLLQSGHCRLRLSKRCFRNVFVSPKDCRILSVHGGVHYPLVRVKQWKSAKSELNLHMTRAAMCGFVWSLHVYECMCTE